MLHSQSEQDPGSMHSTSAGAPTSNSGTQAAQADQPTLYEFLTQLVSNPQARSAFEADPRASLDGAGLGDMTATDVLQGASLVLDYAPAEVVQEYGRSLQSSVDTFAASTQHVAINQLHPAQEHEHQEATEPSMLQNTQDNSSNGDADEQMPADNGNNGNNGDNGDNGNNAEAGNSVSVHNEHIDTDSHNLVNVHDVLSGNDILSENSLAGVGNTVESVGDTVNNTVESVGVGNVVGGVANVAVEDVVGNVTGSVGGVVGGVTGAGDVQTYGGDAEANAGLVGNVGGTVDGVTSGLGLDVL